MFSAVPFRRTWTTSAAVLVLIALSVVFTLLRASTAHSDVASFSLAQTGTVPASAAGPTLPVAPALPNVEPAPAPDAPGTVADPAVAAARQIDVPTVVPRSQWDTEGACPHVGGERSVPERIHLHHTHIPVVHTPEEVPGALQSICRTHRERFADFGYHYAIDPFGTIWQGRGPLPENMTVDVRNGAHAQGFNHESVSVVLIGDFDVAPPTDEARASLEQMLAFLSNEYQLDPQSSVQATSGGGPATRFDDGTDVQLPVVAGHRDTGSGTSCPGEHLYALLPEIRDAVAERLDAVAVT